MSTLLSIVRRAGDANILLVEEYLARVGTGEDGDPEASAPPAAGGAL